jgi:formiminotetrahydrofolate cyclodeaminase
MKERMMLKLSMGELLLWGGIAAMGAAVGIEFLCMIIFLVTGRKLKARREAEYGRQQK